MQIPQIIHNSWHKYLQPLFDSPKMYKLRDNILIKQLFYSDAQVIFRVFSMPLEEIRVVILGQDVYPNGQGTGLAFAVDKNTSLPPSLKIIKEEVERSLHKGFDYHFDRTLVSWFNQGVFLLNTALTVQRHNAGSHLIHWKWFTEEVIKIISEQVAPVWLLWGGKAQSFKYEIINAWKFERDKSWDNYKMSDFVRQQTNFYLEAPHPASEFFSGGKITFRGCNHFNLCNEILKQNNKQTINW